MALIAGGNDPGEVFPDLVNAVKGATAMDDDGTPYEMEFESPENVGGPEGFDRIMQLMNEYSQITLPEEDGGDEVVDGIPFPSPEMPDDTEWL